MDLTHEISNRQNARTNRAKSPYINVLSPTVSTVSEIETIIKITWESGYFNNFYYPNVKIELYKNGVFNSIIESSVLNNGEIDWICFSIYDGDDYTIKISVVGLDYIFGFSEPFTIFGYWKNIEWILTNYDYPINTNTSTYPNGWMITNIDEPDSNVDGWVTFDGTDDKIDTPFTNTDTAMTFAMWIKPTDFLSARYLFARFVSGSTPRSQNDFTLSTDGKISAWLEPGNSAEGFTGRFAGSTATGFTFTGGTDLVVVRFQYGAGGTSVCKATVNNVTKDITDNDDNLAGGIRLRYTDIDVRKRYYIGCRGVNNSNAFKGEMRDFMLFENYISDDDVAKLYAKDYANMASKPVGDSTLYYRMNEVDWSLFLKDYSGFDRKAYPQNINYETFYNRQEV